MAGRIYDVFPKEGERSARNLVLRRKNSTCAKLLYVRRVEFDNDADEGPALVEAFVKDECGQIVLDPDGNPVRVTYRTCCQMLVKEEPIEMVQVDELPQNYGPGTELTTLMDSVTSDPPTIVGE